MRVPRPFRYVGNRGVVLSLLGFLWVLTAVGLLADNLVRTGLPDEQLPLLLRVALWAIPGVAALVITWWKKFDDIAWMLLIIAPSIRLFSFGYGWLSGGFPPGWRGMCVYAATVILVNRCGAGLDRAAPWDGRERREWQRTQL